MKLTYLLLLLAILNIVAFSSKTCIRKATSKPVTSKPITLKRCYIGGCSGQVCSDRNDIEQLAYGNQNMLVMRMLLVSVKLMDNVVGLKLKNFNNVLKMLMDLVM